MIRVTDKQFWMHPYLKSNLDLLKEAIKQNWDGIIIVDGMEGSGKTTAAAGMCYYMNPTFNIDSIAWTPDQIEKAIQKSKPGDAILCDEFVLAGLSTDAMTEMQNLIIKYFTLIRKKRLFIVLVVPYLFLLRRYFAVGRPRALIHMFTPDGIKRGYYRFYNYEQKRYLFFKGIKTWSYPKDCDNSFIGQTHLKSLEELGINQVEYEKRKDAAIKGIFTKKDNEKAKYKNVFYHLVGWVREKHNLMWTELPQFTGLPMTHNAVRMGYARYEEDKLLKEAAKIEAKKAQFRMPD